MASLQLQLRVLTSPIPETTGAAPGLPAGWLPLLCERCSQSRFLLKWELQKEQSRTQNSEHENSGLQETCISQSEEQEARQLVFEGKYAAVSRFFKLLFYVTAWRGQEDEFSNTSHLRPWCYCKTAKRALIVGLIAKSMTALYYFTVCSNPFTLKSDQCQISPAASP